MTYRRLGPFSANTERYRGFRGTWSRMGDLRLTFGSFSVTVALHAARHREKAGEIDWYPLNCEEAGCEPPEHHCGPRT